MKNTAARFLDYDDAFSRFALYSLAAHIILLAFFIVRAAFAPSDPIEIRSAIRVDVVDMPDKIKEIAAPPAPAPKVELPKPEPMKPAPEVKKPEAVKQNVQEAQKKALDKLKAMDAVQRMQQEAAEKAAAEKAKAAAQPTYKGNIVNQGDSLTGLEKIQFDRYFVTLKEHVHQNWSIPQWLEQSNLRAQVLVVLDAKGFVVKKEITKSSGNDIFDGHVLGAIEKSSPFPEPPDKLKGVLNMRGILLNFPD